MEHRKNIYPLKGRGAVGNPAPVRTGSADRQADGDWLDQAEYVDGAAPKLRTIVTNEHARSIITRNQSPDLRFDRSINPYRGCEHGCIYCYARPSHAFHDLSPGLDFESRLFAKTNAPALLRAELAKPSYRPAPLAIGTNTDGYQPIESEWGITRQLIEILAETRHPLILTTKSDRLLRDIDLLTQMARDDLIGVIISITTLDPAIARTLEPRAAHPQKRLEAIRQLRAAGIPVQVNIAPVIPAITDHEIEAIMKASAEAGALRAAAIVLRLPHEVAPLFRAWLEAHFPDRAQKVMHIVQDIRGGKDNDGNFHSRMRGHGPWADLIRQRVRKAAKRYGMEGSFPELRTDLFTPPNVNGQLSLF